MEKWADDLIEIADDASGDYIDRVAADGTIERVVDPETVQRSKLRMDARKWIMARLAARTYGDKLDLNLSATVEVGPLSDAELEARTQARLKALGVEVTGPLLLVPPAPLAAGQDDTDDDLDAEPAAAVDKDRKAG